MNVPGSCEKRQILWKATDPSYLDPCISRTFFLFSIVSFFPFSLAQYHIGEKISKRYFYYNFCNQFLAVLDMSLELMKSKFIRFTSSLRQSFVRPSVHVAIISLPNTRLYFKFFLAYTLGYFVFNF